MKFRSIRIWTVKFFFGENDKPFLERFFLFRRRAKAFMIERSKSSNENGKTLDLKGDSEMENYIMLDGRKFLE